FFIKKRLYCLFVKLYQRSGHYIDVQMNISTLRNLYQLSNEYINAQEFIFLFSSFTLLKNRSHFYLASVFAFLSRIYLLPLTFQNRHFPQAPIIVTELLVISHQSFFPETDSFVTSYGGFIEIKDSQCDAVKFKFIKSDFENLLHHWAANSLSFCSGITNQNTADARRPVILINAR